MAKTVAIIGASADRSKYSNKAVRAFVRQGYTVFPIHPKETEIEGLTVYKSVADVPGPIDMVSLYLPPTIGERVLDDVARKGIVEVWVNPGAESEELVEKARRLGLKPIVACSILGIGESPSSF
jgi:predicted CoA-binding protein